MCGAWYQLRFMFHFMKRKTKTIFIDILTPDIIEKQLSIKLEVRSIQNIHQNLQRISHIWIDNHVGSYSITQKNYEEDTHEEQQIMQLHL